MYGPEHLYLAEAMNTLAALYVRMEEPAKAEPLYTRSLAIEEQAYGAESLQVASTANER